MKKQLTYIVIGVALMGVASAVTLSLRALEGPAMSATVSTPASMGATDTAGGTAVPQVIPSTFGLQVSESKAEMALDKAKAISRATELAGAKAAAAESVVAQRAIVTHKGMASMTPEARRSLGIKVNPENLRSWIVYFNNVRLQRHGPKELRNRESTGTLAVVIDGDSGEELIQCAWVRP